MKHTNRNFLSAAFLFCMSASAFAAGGNGLKGDYFNNTDLDGVPVFSRTDATIGFSWGDSGPGHGVSNNHFSVRWSGQVEAPVSGAVQFSTVSDDGIRLWVNNKLLINDWTHHSPLKRESAPVSLVAGQKYDLKVEFFEDWGGATAHLLWGYSGHPDAVIPQSQLFSTAPSVTAGTYLSDLDPVLAVSGWGPYQRDRSNGEQGQHDGSTISIGGVKFAKGLGVHSFSDMRYLLGGKYHMFSAELGVDDEVGNRGSVIFQVWLDGLKVYESPVLRGSNGPRSIDLSVAGKTELKLIVLDAGDGNGYDHADWADARLTAASNSGGGGGGVTVPAAPASLVAAAADKQVTLAWSTVSGATSYNLYRGTAANGEAVSPIKTGIAGGMYVDPGLINGTMYFYRVAGVNAMGTGEKSGEASAKPSGLPVPAAPSNLMAAAGDKQVTLTWMSVAGATSYSLYRGTAAGAEGVIPIKTGIAGASYIDPGLTNGTTYFYKLAAVNANGTGDKSNEASAKPAGLPAPAAPTALMAAAGDKQVTLTWTSVSGATSYSLYRGTAAGAEGDSPMKTGITGASYVDPGLTNGTTYFYKLAAVNANGTGNKSNEASAKPAGLPAPPAPTALIATAGDKQVTLAWTSSAGATSYNLYRGTAVGAEGVTPIKTGITGASYVDPGLTNGTTYFYKLAAVNANGTGDKSNEASAKPVAPPLPDAPTGLTATAGDKQVTLAWSSVSGATSYNLYRGTSANGEAGTPVKTALTGNNTIDTGLTNGTTYFYKLAAVNANGTGEKSGEASAKPVAPPAPPAPATVTASAGNQQVLLTWASVAGATSYNVYRGTTANGEATTPVATGVTDVTFMNSGLTNGTMYFYKVAAVNANGTSVKSTEANAMPTAPGLALTPAQKDAFRFLRQSTWGPTQALMDHVAQVGKPAFIDEQVAAVQSVYPDELINMPNMELVQERFFQNAILGDDQLRQRVAWALSQIFVASAQKVDNTHAMVPYIRILQDRAFDNVLNVMRDVSLSPAMGEFLDMVNNKKADPTKGTLPNENYAREWIQLFAIGLQEVNDDGTPKLGSNGQPIPTYDQSTVADMARVLTGWTYGDTKTTNPTNTNPAFYGGPMKPVEKFHDTGQKTVLGEIFPAGQTTQQDFDHALSVVFNHHNVGPFLCRELIQRLVTSNPSPTYIHDVAAVFNNNGQGVRGDLKAVVKAILLHPEAANGTPTSGKFSEPALFVLNISRALGAKVVDHPFLTDFSEDMGQKVWFAPSVFNYFSPNYRAGSLFAPELQIWTTATAMSRTNFVASLISGGFGSNVTLDLTPYTPIAADPNALVDTVNSLIMGGTMSSQMRQAILTALASSTSNTDRIRTAVYLTAVSMQYQVEH